MEALPRPVKTYHNATYKRISDLHGFDGTGKTVLITGGASGIGYGICRAFARANVQRLVLISRSSEAQVKAKTELKDVFPQTEVLTYQADVTDEVKMQDILEELEAVHMLVLNAAIAHRRAAASEIDIEDIRKAFEVNVISSFVLTKSYLTKPMPSVDHKTIVNVSSGAAHTIMPYRVGYGASKAASAQVMQAFASEFHDGNCKIVSFHPGSIYTPGVAENIPKHMFVWDDITLPADFAVWLAGPESQFLHGRHVWANWDVDELLSLKAELARKPNFLTIGLVL